MVMSSKRLTVDSYLRYIPECGMYPAHYIVARKRLHHAIEWVVEGTVIGVTLWRDNVFEEIPAVRASSGMVTLGHESRLHPGLRRMVYMADTVQRVDVVKGEA
jgi:hypothetical protein